jgi:hypothetical protein
MARKTVNREKVKEQIQTEEESAAVAAPKKKRKAPATPRKKRTKVAPVIRYKVFWAIYNQSMKRVATYDYADEAAAKEKAEDLSKKTPHFVLRVKEEIAE